MSNNTERNSDKWLDFSAIKSKVDVGVIIHGLKLEKVITERGNEWVGFCPFHPDKEEEDAFHISAEEDGFHCSCCKREGSIVDFVHQYITFKGETIDLSMAIDWIDNQMAFEASRRATLAQTERDRQDLAKQQAAEIAKAGQFVVVVDSTGLFVDFAEACHLVTSHKATTTDFVAVRVDKLQELLGQSPVQQKRS